jgi:hypothetical protein
MTDLGEIKRDRPCNRRWLLRHGALALPFILVGIPARAVERVGSVDVKGEAFAELEAARRTLDRAAPVFLGDEVVTGVASRLGMRLGRDTTIRLGEQARLKIDRFLVDAGGEMTLRSGRLLFDSTAAQRTRGSADSQPLRADRGTRHAILRRAEQRALWRVCRARLGSGDLGGSASNPARGRRYGLCHGWHAADAGQTMGATTHPRRARKRQLRARGPLATILEKTRASNRSDPFTVVVNKPVRHDRAA